MPGNEDQDKQLSHLKEQVEKLEKKVEELLKQGSHQQLSHLTEKVVKLEKRAEELLKLAPDEKINVENLTVQKLELQNLTFRLDSINVKELSGALNLGNNFGLNPKELQKKEPKPKESSSPEPKSSNSSSSTSLPTSSQPKQETRAVQPFNQSPPVSEQKEKTHSTRTDDAKGLQTKEPTTPDAPYLSNSSQESGIMEKERAPISSNQEDRSNWTLKNPVIKDSNQRKITITPIANESQPHLASDKKKKTEKKEVNNSSDEQIQKERRLKEPSLGKTSKGFSFKFNS